MQKPINLNLSVEDDDDSQQVFTVAKRETIKAKYVVRLHNAIQGPNKYGPLLHILETADEGDSVELDVSSPGGVLDTAVLLRRGIESSNASVIGRIGPTCASAAGAIILACDGWYVDDMSTLMVHTASLSYGFGKVSDLHAASTHNLKLIERFIRLTYTGFLTEDEILSVLDGKEYYFDAEELAERLEAFAAWREAAYGGQDEEEEQEADD